MKYLILDSFLSSEDAAALRYATDMFIHVQVSDAYSSSVQEYLLCNKKVINGSWLRYDEFEDNGKAPYFVVDNFGTLSETIVKAYNSPNKVLSARARQFIINGGTKTMIKNWNAFFESCVSE